MTGPAARSLAWAAGLGGFALGGFFDGILLHQILQWHHLLSNVEAARDIRLQILADGLFHAAMYVIGAVALLRLWRTRAATQVAGAGRRLWGAALVGFGAWHLVDGVLSHWVLGIHRIRMDSAHPLAWDLVWFVGFGVLPAVLGAWMLRRLDGDPDGDSSSRNGSGSDNGNDSGPIGPRPSGAARGRRKPGGSASAAATLGLCVAVAGPLAAWPVGSDTSQVVVLFGPGRPSGQAFDALARLDARVVWVDRSGALWAVKMDRPQAAWRLYGHGAIWVSTTGPALGCLAFSRAPAAS